ncbi:hypothetical protein QFC21_004808 [Naganishia friedmannii]|uniref:Uncharacterized protein n=1 Tax=Naganishia friedmannii TaxID=89922 RepID=A0ACC2VDT5_9TREE|nr:hypothetical protein QFC21_004808 [Naganishia friedmannii]
MRFNAIIISALAVASLGAKAAPAVNGDLEARNSPCGCTTTVTVTATPTKPGNPGPTGYPGDDGCKYYCIFEHWDCDYGNVAGITQQQPNDCTQDCVSNDKCKCTVSNGGFCYPKDNGNAFHWNYNRNWGSKLAIEGRCQKLKDDCDKETNPNKKKYPSEMFPGCYETKVCPPKKGGY